MKQKLSELWQALTIKKKIGTFTGLVFLIILVAVVFDIWVVKFSLIDFNNILEENSKISDVVNALDGERTLFESYIKNPDDEKRVLLEDAIENSKKTIEALPFEYENIGEERYAKTWAIRNSYEVYEEQRNELLNVQENTPEYINKLYMVYSMQDYLQSYAKTLMRYTIEESNSAYQKRVPYLIRIPMIVVVFSLLLLFGMLELAKLMNRTIISPVMELVKTSKKIAANDFFVEDVQVKNKDELGELVHAFNKMKYATGEYIMALEEKRKTLDLLHEEELEKLEVEKQLETIKLDLLKSQVNPHFLFNTLNVIGGMANLEDAEVTEKMIKALSSLFRYNLKTPEIEVALIRELHVISDYMYLQQMRFGSRITYTVDCQVDEENIMVPTFTFQPLVENAIIHGLSKKEEGGKIRIRIWEREEMIHITVADTGVGIPEEELESLRIHLENGENTKLGIGVGNIYRRIYAMYQGSSFEIFSREKVGTVIVIQIQKK